MAALHLTLSIDEPEAWEAELADFSVVLDASRLVLPAYFFSAEEESLVAADTPVLVAEFAVGDGGQGSGGAAETSD